MEVSLQPILQPIPDQSSVAHQVRRCVAGDPVAWKDLVSSYYRLIYFLCYKFTRSSSDAEDLTQDIFLKLFCNLSRFDSEKGSFQNWIKNVTRNHLVDHYRATQVVRASESLDAGLYGKKESCIRVYHLTDARPSPEQSYATLEVRTRIYAALGQVSATSRDAVILCDLEDRDYREAAEILGIPIGTVKSRLNRGRTELARILSAEKEASVSVQEARSEWRKDLREVATVKHRRRFVSSVQYQPTMAQAY